MDARLAGPTPAPGSVPAPVPGPTPAPGPADAPVPGSAPVSTPGAAARLGPPLASGGPPLPEALVDAPLLAAGVLDALGRRRRAALWRAATGASDRDTGPEAPTVSAGGRGTSDELPVPSGAAALALDALRVGADPAAVRFLDLALRHLAAALAERGGTPPVVYAAWLAGQELHLQFAEDQERPPPPWRFGQSAQFWSVRCADVPLAAAETRTGEGEGEAEREGDRAAPYPGFVGLGTRGEARLLLNLESVPGLVSVAGPRERRTGVLAAAALELATSGRAESARVTLVGFGPELTALAPGRVGYVADVPELLRALDAEANPEANPDPDPDPEAEVGAAESGRAEGTARARGRGPHLVLVGVEPTDDEAERLAALAGDPKRRCGFLVGHAEGRVAGAVWEFTLGEGVLTAPPLGLELRARPLSPELTCAVVELFTATEADGDPTEGRGPAFRADLSDGGRPDVYARLLGPYEILGLAEPEEAHSALLHEALALLLLRREGLHPRVFAAALRHHGVGDAGCQPLLERLADWLGTEPDGAPRLGADREGRLVLRPSVISDWDVLRTLHHGITGERGARLSSPVRRLQLVDAMELARGPLLADRAEGAYGWLAYELGRDRHPLLVAEIGLALAAAHLRLGEPARAVEAVRAALRTAPGDPRLRAELLCAARATGERAALAQAEALVTAPASPGPVRTL